MENKKLSVFETLKNYPEIPHEIIRIGKDTVTIKIVEKEICPCCNSVLNYHYKCIEIQREKYDNYIRKINKLFEIFK